ncbi:hypothetical protein HMPREF1119_1280 [Haemophilus parainfluenzae HK2019]|uniref:Uncharacterized protein n=1 Tax=Haemophilus parainfluenzae HK2019 TaxID=1095746 RepID=A0ABP2NWU6_HAEPA|nr:hypothetical protein HMPREF1119_1280 [Haemophilus parainfluenzae HK2019]
MPALPKPIIRFCVCIICLREMMDCAPIIDLIDLFLQEIFAKSPKIPLNVLVGFWGILQRSQAV